MVRSDHRRAPRALSSVGVLIGADHRRPSPATGTKAGAVANPSGPAAGGPGEAGPPLCAQRALSRGGTRLRLDAHSWGLRAAALAAAPEDRASPPGPPHSHVRAAQSVSRRYPERPWARRETAHSISRTASSGERPVPPTR